jgi:hypothetical protein
VVSRKERLLQEALERARKAEAEAVAPKAQLKTETTTSKKLLRETETALAESTALSSKCEREYIALGDSLRGMKSRGAPMSTACVRTCVNEKIAGGARPRRRGRSMPSC